ncbi:bifunctional adenosylcobinamide kinase/adenosylcobinamide-phosphate guanylyltransferase [Shinella sp. HZN7]|jgi:adenosylcobinamide kinase/adenosylcobinamide-phosphate guanylyltransferase|uniref:bifunctional adenosylcobinamide kinase/adenosylcobinamide-phosphate guanylyltransferase n=1 Tax=Shinella sp. (strain HZN7) TaxID=879274 RepID=UPI0007DA89A3|nr:bifunctional adenosylcobinamide kinase/adenosylcobinamide-phosphate guanylyltransferase [Shinella sp. HZN7]ANH04423.1 bifunctional adenosylcobinamide kinase/adenosylcobinamide-phosphate guanylyltransferase [Shinella sp. HZN7]
MTSTSPGAVLVLGGARSGKSAFAERLVAKTGLSRHYIATGRAFDDEMRARIARHREDRGDGWQTHEEPLALAARIRDVARADRAVLVDCLTLWVTNLMLEERDIAAESSGLLEAIRQAPGRIVLVSNEVGLGIVPDNRMAREFRDHAGRLHQQVAALVPEVYFVAAGLPLKMKG